MTAQNSLIDCDLKTIKIDQIAEKQRNAELLQFLKNQNGVAAPMQPKQDPWVNTQKL